MVTKKYTYDAFGVEINPDTNDVNVFRYCGEYFDSETGTVYLRARYYQASTGRFISRDSYAGRRSDPLSLNLYTYCRNNPIRYVDPSGHSYATLPSGNWMTINSASDARLLSERRNQFSDPLTKTKTTTAPLTQVKTTSVVSISQKNNTTYTEAVKYNIKYDVPLYGQGRINLCWAYSQVMVEAYKENKIHNQAEADLRAETIAKQVNGDSYWDHGIEPRKLKKCMNMLKVMILKDYGG